MFRYRLRTLMIVTTVGCVLLAISRAYGAASALFSVLILIPMTLEWALWCRELEQAKKLQ